MSSLDICAEVLDSVSSLFNLDYSMRIVWNLSQIDRRQLLCKQRVNSDGPFIFLPQQCKPQTGGKVSSFLQFPLIYHPGHPWHMQMILRIFSCG